MGDSNVINSNKITNLQCLMDDSELINLQKVTNIQFLKELNDNLALSSNELPCGKWVALEMNRLTICHQNIHGLKGKINEFTLSLAEVMPHLICLSEHHLKYTEIDIVHTPTYKLGAKYCRMILKCGGVCIYIHKDIDFSNINLLKYCKEEDLEIAAVKLKLNKKKVIVNCAYRAPSGDVRAGIA